MEESLSEIAANVVSSELNKNKSISSLAPKILTDSDEIKKIKPYLDLIEATINDENITNIAITGGYGSGKSTILKTFQSLHPNSYKYLNISLASFNDINKEIEKLNSDSDATKLESSIKNVEEQIISNQNEVYSNISNRNKKEELERLLEISILQQIFYQVKPSEIPDSRFKRIINYTDKTIFYYAFSCIVWLISILFLFKFNYIWKLNPNSWNLSYSFDFFSFFILVLFFIGIGFIVKGAIRLFNNSKISKLNIKGELELGDDNIDKSVFNKHLEEILYFFERTEHNVVIIEDLDRFDTTNIFTKLREINILLNNSKLIKKPVNFIYAIRDGIFEDKKERVKFFEYIIPIIPFINPTNASDQLTKLIQDANLVGVLSHDFTNDIVTFIDDIDMRLLINIFHEYQLYKKNLSTGLNQDKLFAIITYKNIFPEDFADLPNRKGNLYTFINKKPNYIQGLIRDLDIKIEKATSRLNNIQNEKISSLFELKAIYINALRMKLPNANSIFLNGVLEFNELLENDNFEKLKTEKLIFFNSFNHQFGKQYLIVENIRSSISFEDVENLVNENFTYDEREELINDKIDKTSNILRLEIEKLNERKTEIGSWDFVKIFQEIDINIYLDKFSDNLLVRNLLLNGYIDENYNDYISLFHGVNLTTEDYTFDRNLRSGIYSKFDYSLGKTKNLIKRISPKYFKRDIILNYDLLDFISENHDSYQNYYHDIIDILSNEKDKSIKFIDGYVSRKKNHERLIESLSANWGNFWNFVSLESNYQEEKINNYLQLLLKYANINDIKNQDNSRNLSDYISKKSDFLNLIDTKDMFKKIEEIIKILNIKFVFLEKPSTSNISLFEFSYSNNFYVINKNNVECILLQIGKKVNIDSINTSNYTTILESNCPELVKYIDTSINDYVKNIFLKLENNHKEDKTSIILLLNNEKLLLDNKLKIVQSLHSKIENLVDFGTYETQEILLNENKVVAKWSNIFVFYDWQQTNEFNDITIQFLTNNKHLFSQQSIYDIKDLLGEYIKEFCSSLILEKKFDIDTYSSLLKCIPEQINYIDNLEFEVLDYEKVALLVQEKIIFLSIENFEKLKDGFDSLHLELLFKFQNLYIKHIKLYPLSNEDYVLFLESSIVSQKNKIRVIESLNDEQIIDTPKLARIVCDIIISSNYKLLNFEIIKGIFKHHYSIEKRVRLLNLYYEKLIPSQIIGLIELLNFDYKRIFKKQSKPSFPYSLFNEQLFKKLQKSELIIRFELIEKKNSLKVFAKY